MDDNELNLFLQVMELYEGFNKIDFESQYFLDQEVMDCQVKLYMLMFVEEENMALQKYKEFEEAYKKLSKEKREYIKGELTKILETQDKKNKEKEKRL